MKPEIPRKICLETMPAEEIMNYALSVLPLCSEYLVIT